jgi:hypothetical protein
MPNIPRSLLFAAILLSGCDPKAPADPAAGNASASPDQENSALALPEVLPAPRPELDRAALLTAVARAASAHAAGQQDRQNLAGRRFTLKIRFGCGDAGGTGAGPISWTYDEAEQRLTIRARPDIDAEAAGFGEDGEETIEAVEGFWISQPWLLTDACAAAAEEGEGAAAAAPPPTVGIAQHFTAQDSRVQRRAERSYEIVRRAEPAIVPPAEGFNLVLEGRLEAWPQGQVIRCRGAGSAARPVCVISAEFDRVAFENPQNGLTIAQWSAG